MPQQPVMTRARGFSLIEILVVMFIIALFTGGIALSVNLGGSVQNQLESEVERLLALTTLAEDQAVLTGEPIGLLILPPRQEPQWKYTWQRYRGGQWVPTDEPLTGALFPQGVEITLEVEGQLVDYSRLEDSETPPLPNIVFFPGGEVTPFTLTLLADGELDRQIVISSERTGQVERLTEQQALELL